MLFSTLAVLIFAGVQAAPTDSNSPTSGLASCPFNSKEIVNPVTLGQMGDFKAKIYTVSTCCSKDSDGLGDWLDSHGHFVCSKLKGPAGQHVSSTFLPVIPPKSCTGGSHKCAVDSNGCCFGSAQNKRAVTSLASCPKGTVEKTNSVNLGKGLRKLSTCCISSSSGLSDSLSKAGELQCKSATSGYATTAGAYTLGAPFQPLGCSIGSHACAKNNMGCCDGPTTADINDRALYARSEDATISEDTIRAKRSSNYISCPNDKGVYADRRTVEGIDLMVCCQAPCNQYGCMDSEMIQIYKLMVDGNPICRDLSFPDPKTPGYFVNTTKPKSCDNGAVQCKDHPSACCVPKK